MLFMVLLPPNSTHPSLVKSTEQRQGRKTCGRFQQLWLEEEESMASCGLTDECWCYPEAVLDLKPHRQSSTDSARVESLRCREQVASISIAMNKWLTVRFLVHNLKGFWLQLWVRSTITESMDHLFTLQNEQNSRFWGYITQPENVLQGLKFPIFFWFHKYWTHKCLDIMIKTGTKPMDNHNPLNSQIFCIVDIWPNKWPLTLT